MQPTQFRNHQAMNEPRIFGGQYNLNTPIGVVSTNLAPPLPPRPIQNTVNFGSSNRFGMNLHGVATGYNSYNTMGRYGYDYNNGLSNMYNNNIGYNGLNSSTSFPEHKFIQIAEENSRPAFQNIESLVGAIGNIASMLDSTFFALTSSFRAILGVAANFAHLRGVFQQFWTSLALYRRIVWLYRKILFVLKLSKTNPALSTFKEAFNNAEYDVCQTGLPSKGSSLPVMFFLAFILTAPYLIMKMIGGNCTNKSKDPKSWENPLEAVVLYNFEANNSNELTIRSGEHIILAPKQVQNDNSLLNTGWALASKDKCVSGVVPVNYIQGTKKPIPLQLINNQENEKVMSNVTDF